MRPNGYASVVWVMALAAVIGCGSSSSSTSSAPKPSGLKKRVLLTNVEASVVNIIDASKDAPFPKTLAAPGATKIITANGQTAVLSSTQHVLTIINNTTEAVAFTMQLDDQPVDIAITKDGATVFAAERNLDEVRFGTTADGNVSPSILHVPSARRLVMSPGGAKLLVFSDPESQTNINSIFVVDTASKAIVQITSPNFDQPFSAVFGASDTQAFILNCAGECGSTHLVAGVPVPNPASVVSLDFSGVFSSPASPATFGPVIPVAAATSGFLSGNNLFVAGTAVPAPTGPGASCPLSRCGILSVVNTGSSTVSSSIPITDGLHEKIASTTTGRLYIGASGCSVDQGSVANTVRGCLTILNMNTLATTFPLESSFRQDFDVTGFQPITNRNVIYVIQGGELDIFDTTTDALETGITQPDILGNAIDCVQIDP
ncbi:MAG TPA: hypothetical protein VKH81_02235 [Candidatus Angelobacter sp.]|nr:hypothetical protein [Candidatus Angelobacter sp.]